MASIQTALQLQDNVSQPLAVIDNSLNVVMASIKDTRIEFMRMFVTAAIRMASEELNVVDSKVNSVEQGVKQASNEQQDFTSSIKDSVETTDRLSSKISQVAQSIAKSFDVGKVIAYSDELQLTSTRLGTINDGMQSTEAVQRMVFSAAQNSSTSYQATADAVTNLELQAKDAFGSTAEMVNFAEQLNKQFILSGTSSSDIQTSMDSLVSSLSSGVMSGEQMNSIYAAAPSIIQTIADYMGQPVEKVKDLASQGGISAEIVKNALLSAATATDSRFQSMDKTFGQIWTTFKDNALMQFQPILAKINEFANSEGFQSFISSIIFGIQLLSFVLSAVIDLAIAAANEIISHWSTIGPIIFAIVAIFLIFKAVTFAASVVSGIMTTAQWALNAAMAANPIMLIVLGLIILIAIICMVIGIINELTGSSISALGFICGAFAVSGAVIVNSILGVINLIITVGINLYNLISTFASALSILFTNPIESIKMMFYGLFDAICGIVEGAAGMLDAIFGGDLSSKVADFHDSVQNFLVDHVGEPAVESTKLDASDYTLDTIDYGDAYNAGNNFGTGLENKVKSFGSDYGSIGDEVYDPATDLSNTNLNNNMSNSSTPTSVDDTALNTANTADNTAALKDTVSSSEEDLAYLRDSAERDVINRFTTAEVKVSMGGVKNIVNHKTDLDGMINYMEQKLSETLASTAEQSY